MVYRDYGYTSNVNDLSSAEDVLLTTLEDAIDWATDHSKNRRCENYIVQRTVKLEVVGYVDKDGNYSQLGRSL